jgi:hypothetical protein
MLTVLPVLRIQLDYVSSPDFFGFLRIVVCSREISLSHWLPGLLAIITSTDCWYCRAPTHFQVPILDSCWSVNGLFCCLSKYCRSSHVLWFCRYKAYLIVVSLTEQQQPILHRPRVSSTQFIWVKFVGFSSNILIFLAGCKLLIDKFVPFGPVPCNLSLEVLGIEIWSVDLSMHLIWIVLCHLEVTEETVLVNKIWEVRFVKKTVVIRSCSIMTVVLPIVVYLIPTVICFHCQPCRCLDGSIVQATTKRVFVFHRISMVHARAISLSSSSIG